MKFLKYRDKWSHGYSPYQYTTFHSEEDREYILEDIKRNSDWSDKYRGVEWEVVDKPPQTWVESEILESNRKITELQNYLLELVHPQ